MLSRNRTPSYTLVLAQDSLYLTLSEAQGNVQDSGSSVLAFDPASGDQSWRHDVRGQGFSEPAVANGTVYVTATARSVYVGAGTVEAFDRETGERVWNVTIDDRYGVDTTPVVVGDTVYVGPVPFHVYALADSGTATPDGPVGGFIGWLAANPPLNGLFIGYWRYYSPASFRWVGGVGLGQESLPRRVQSGGDSTGTREGRLPRGRRRTSGRNQSVPGCIGLLTERLQLLPDR